MKLLALETSSDWCSAALLLDKRVLAREELAVQKHSELLLPMIDALLREAGIMLRQLDGIAFGSGPGSFTGLRIACGVTQGLALGADLHVVGVSSLQTLAQACGAERVVACLDARLNEVYHAAYERDGKGWRVLHEPSLCAPQQAPALEGVGWVGVGSGFLVHAEALSSRYPAQLDRLEAGLQPLARDMLPLAFDMFERGLGTVPDQAMPLYVRNKVALTTQERRDRAEAQARSAEHSA